VPCETQPGSVGHSATNTPSSSGSTMTRNFMCLGMTADPPRFSLQRTLTEISTAGNRGLA
jgi:hypothetical protein